MYDYIQKITKLEIKCKMKSQTNSVKYLYLATGRILKSSTEKKHKTNLLKHFINCQQSYLNKNKMFFFEYFTQLISLYYSYLP